MLLNEIGVDPGIDHMSAMRIIHDVAKQRRPRWSASGRTAAACRRRKATTTRGLQFRGARGRSALPARMRASSENGKLVELPRADLFTWFRPLPVDGIGELQAYPEPRLAEYIDNLRFAGASRRMFAVTLPLPRLAAQCLKKVVDLGLLDGDAVTYPPE